MEKFLIWKAKNSSFTKNFGQNIRFVPYDTIATSEHKELAGKLRNVMATYNEAEDLINIGAYKNGTNREIDYAIQKIQAVNEFLMQKTDEKFEFNEEIDLLRKLFEN